MCEFVRFNLFNESMGDYFGQVIPRTNNVVRMLDVPLNEMLMNFEHKVRKNLKKADASGLTVEIDTTGEHLDDFLAIYYSTMDRDAAEIEYYFSKEFYRQINSMNGNYAYFHVMLGGKIIATELVLMGRQNMYSYLGGTNSEYYSYRPNDYLKYEIIKWGMEKGYKCFVLGGGYGADDGIYRYKKSFAPDGIFRFYTGQTIFLADEYSKLCAMRSELPDSSYFPKYRA